MDGTAVALLPARGVVYSAGMKTLLASLALVTVACGSSAPPPAESTTKPTSGETAKHDEHHEKGDDHHAGLAPALKDFHGVIAPVWHSEPGAVRNGKACESVKAMQEKATATADAELIAATKDLGAACAKDGKPEVEAKLRAVHDRFHAAAKIEKHDNR